MSDEDFEQKDFQNLNEKLINALINFGVSLSDSALFLNPHI